MCDFSSDVDQLSTPLIPGYQTFDKKWLDIDGGPDSVSLQQWMDIYAPSPEDDLLLQIDIEGAEYRNLNHASEATLRRFRIIILELHELTWVLDPGRAEAELGPLLRKLDATHVCVHAHPNNCCGEAIDPESGRNIPRVIELTLLRRDRFGDGEASLTGFPPAMPHPLDIALNVFTYAPLHMNANWLGTPESDPVTQLKKTQDQLHYVAGRREQENLQLQVFVATDEILNSSLQNLYEVVSHSMGGAVPAIAIPTDLDQVDVARGKSFHLSESYADMPVAGLVKAQEPFFFHTALAPRQSITIDLESSTKLALLVLKNRKDGCRERAKHLFWCVHEEILFSPDHMLPVLAPGDFLSLANGVSITPLLGMTGRYFTLFCPVDTAIHLSRLQLYPS